MTGNGKRPKTIRLADLDTPLDDVELPSGRVVAVRQLDGIGTQLARRISAVMDEARKAQEAGKPLPEIGEALDDFWEVTRRCLPEATEEEVRSLTPVQCWAVMKIASSQGEEVEAMLGNGSGRPAVAEAAPDPTIPSPTSSPASP